MSSTMRKIEGPIGYRLLNDGEIIHPTDLYFDCEIGNDEWIEVDPELWGVEYTEEYLPMARRL